MIKQLFIAICTVFVALTGMISSASAQTLQQFSQQDFENLMKSNPELIQQVVKADGSVDRVQLEQILRDRYNYTDRQELPGSLEFAGPDQRLYSERTPLEIENDVRLQKRLEEERKKAYEAYKKRQANKPPQ